MQSCSELLTAPSSITRSSYISSTALLLFQTSTLLLRLGASTCMASNGSFNPRVSRSPPWERRRHEHGSLSTSEHATSAELRINNPRHLPHRPSSHEQRHESITPVTHAPPQEQRLGITSPISPLSPHVDFRQQHPVLPRRRRRPSPLQSNDGTNLSIPPHHFPESSRSAPPDLAGFRPTPPPKDRPRSSTPQPPPPHLQSSNSEYSPRRARSVWIQPASHTSRSRSESPFEDASQFHLFVEATSGLSGPEFPPQPLQAWNSWPREESSSSLTAQEQQHQQQQQEQQMERRLPSRLFAEAIRGFDEDGEDGEMDDDELPDYAQSQLEASERLRAEAARRAAELERRWAAAVRRRS